MILIFLFVDYEPKISKWKSALRALDHASAVYKEKHGKPPVIIYDNISQLDPKILDYLQSDAYDNAYRYDNHNYIAVFISNKFSTLNHMESKY